MKSERKQLLLALLKQYKGDKTRLPQNVTKRTIMQSTYDTVYAAKRLKTFNSNNSGTNPDFKDLAVGIIKDLDFPVTKSNTSNLEQHLLSLWKKKGKFENNVSFDDIYKQLKR